MRMPPALLLLLVLPLAAAPWGCPSTGPAAGPAGDAVAAPALPRRQQPDRGTILFDTPLGVWSVEAEIARTPEERARGLMFRRELLPDRGMVFVFERAAVQSFWMHDTLLALDMIHLDDDRIVVGVVANAAPRTDTPRTVHRAARYVLEVSAGEAAAHGVGPGVRARFVGID
jgi:uncharacterized membrane protein (UPF0127 family)